MQPAGSGKSAVYQTTSAIANGVISMIEPTLVLTSDQVSKLNVASKECGGLARSCQLDLLTKDSDGEALANNVISAMREKKVKSAELGAVSFVLFTLPEALVLPIWTSLVEKLAHYF